MGDSWPVSRLGDDTEMLKRVAGEGAKPSEDGESPPRAPHGISRRDFLKSAAVAAPFVMAGGSLVGTSDRAVAVGSGTRRITILQSTDIHGQITTHPEAFWDDGKNVSFRQTGSYARIAKIAEEVRRENPNGVVMLDTGDFFQGSAVAGLSRGEALTPLLNEMTYDLVIPGNWEFAYGSEQMRNLMNSLRYPTLCANLYRAGASEPIFRPYYVKKVKGVRLGFIGYTDDLTPKRQAPSNTVGLDLKPPTHMIRDYVKILREQEKCDVVFVMTHVGLSKEIVQSNNPDFEGVDFILGSHTHDRVREPLQGRFTKVVEPGAFGSFVGRLDLFVRNGTIKDYKYELIEVDADRYEEDTDVAEMVDEVIAPYREKISVAHANTLSPLYRYTVVETSMDNFIADAIKNAAGTEIGISNAFRFAPAILPGAVTEGHIWDMLPVNAKLKKGKVTGEQLVVWWEQELENVFAKDPNMQVGGWVPRVQGMSILFTAGNDKGSRVQEVRVNGDLLEMTRLYSIGSCRREGAPEDELCRFAGIKEPYVFNFTVHDALRNFLKSSGTIDYRMAGQVKATDLEDPVLSHAQLPDVGYRFR